MAGLLSEGLRVLGCKPDLGLRDVGFRPDLGPI